MYLYMPNGQENIVKYKDHTSCFKLCKPEPTSMSVRYLMPASLGGISFRVLPLYTGLISTLLALAGSRHSCTLPFALVLR